MKEVIQMAWKLVGTSAGTPVTLLKCVDRKDAEAQMARLEVEGYYKNLSIYAVETDVPLSPSLIRARKRAIDAAKDQVGARKLAANVAKPRTSRSKGGGKSSKAAKKPADDKKAKPAENKKPKAAADKKPKPPAAGKKVKKAKSTPGAAKVGKVAKVASSKKSPRKKPAKAAAKSPAKPAKKKTKAPAKSAKPKKTASRKRK